VTADPTPTAPAPPSSSSSRHPLGTVYLFHFDQRYEHAGHYTGWAEDLDTGWPSIWPAAGPVSSRSSPKPASASVWPAPGRA
jgi:hypothetical protein